MEHRIALGAKVVFAGDSYVYEIANYQTLLACPEGCEDDHDCYPEPYVCVSYTVTTSKPLRNLNLVFDQANSLGRKPLPEEMAF